MHLPKEALLELQEVYQKVHGNVLPEEEVFSLAQELLQLKALSNGQSIPFS